MTSCPIQKDLIVLDDVHKVFAVDALTSSHPLTSKEDSIVLPEQIMEQFDTISYSKVWSARSLNHSFFNVRISIKVCCLFKQSSQIQHKETFSALKAKCW